MILHIRKALQVFSIISPITISNMQRLQLSLFLILMFAILIYGRTLSAAFYNNTEHPQEVTSLPKSFGNDTIIWSGFGTGINLSLPSNLRVEIPPNLEPVTVLQIFDDSISSSPLKIEISAQLTGYEGSEIWEQSKPNMQELYNLQELTSETRLIDSNMGKFRIIKIPNGEIWETEIYVDDVRYLIYGANNLGNISKLYELVLSGIKFTYDNQLPKQETTNQIEYKGTATNLFPNLKFPYNGTKTITCAYYEDDPNCHQLSLFALDFNLNYETVRAANTGIAHVSSDSCVGTYIWIVDGSEPSYFTLYGHLSSAILTGSVQQGNNIGISGATGSCSTGPHLHFLLNYNGNNIKPEPMCGQAGFLRWQVHSDCWSSCCGCLHSPFQEDRAEQWPQPNFAEQFGNSGFSANRLIDDVPPSCEVEAIEMSWSNTWPLQLFSWPAAADESGVAGYYIYWGPDPNGEGDIWVTEPAYTPTTANSEEGVFYLRAAAKDNVGNVSPWFTVATWGYDTQSPDGTLTVQGDVDTVQTLPIYLSITPVVDGGSPISMMRFSKDGEVWLDWEPFATTRFWQLEDESQPQTIYAQIQDASGNLSTVMTTTVQVDLTLQQPYGAGFTISCSTFAMSAGTQTGSSYTVHSTVGQPYETGQMQGGNYQVKSGYWSACGQSSTPPPINTHIYLPLIANP